MSAHRIGAKKRLSPGAADNFPADTLFGRFARAVCAAGCLPRKELYESWEVAKRVRRRFKGGRVVDLACGHGLLSHALLLMEPSYTSALGVDLRLPESAQKLQDSLSAAFGRLSGSVQLMQADLQSVAIGPGDLVVSAHACGRLSDRVLERAVEAGARVAVLPCCHAKQQEDVSDLLGWMDVSLAIDVRRVERLRARGYRAHALQIPAEITPKNRLLLAHPAAPDAD